MPSQALHLIKVMSFEENLEHMNEYVFATALASCSDMRALEEGRQCHAYVLKSGLVFHSHVRNALLHMYFESLSMEDALRVFETVPGLDVFALNSMINGFVESGRLSDAMDIVSSMVKEVELWDHVTYVSVLGLCATSKDARFGWQVHDQILKRGIAFSVFVGSGIVDMYGKCGNVQSARCAFYELPGKNVVSWTAIMATFAQNGFFEESLKLFLEMGIDEVQPNEFSYAVLLNSCAGLSALKNGDALNAHAEKSGHKSHVVVGNALINMYLKSGSVEDARSVFASMRQRDIISWNSIITGYSHHGLGREALEAFHDMLTEGEVPTYVTFVGVLSACGNLGLVDDGFYYLDHFMKDLGIEPGVEHYTCMVRLLCRAGQLDKAESFMRYTCNEWDIVAWRTLLSSCQVHRYYNLGKRVAEHILQLYPDDVGTYVIVSNMHAKANRWDEVVKIRKLMRGRDIKKEPGVSWIQIRGETHVFASEDKKHPFMSQICDKVQELLNQIKLIGYVPNIDSVLHDVEDEQKEEYLSYHSEKLAIAFGLISIPPGAPIHVIKNLRMCDDCHTAVKLISIVTSRKIIIRDANRFHCFDTGVCSCDDYW
ncbi:hypothetical protein J5N97_006901 [Dioscorea zingiberensis]|uniref:DYW domain-containing protein n=1 Tax=Dioscorea zingiberensis TaxID=325984 RepID=A0A9D5HT47_9LILI|nr:hypothetical protein J5N97_006901 [Dioscorea zingiberensis]